MIPMPVFHKLGDGALLVTLSDEVSLEVNETVLRICTAVEDANVPGVEEAQPAYSSLCVYFDPAKVSVSWLQAFVSNVVGGVVVADVASVTDAKGAWVAVSGSSAPDQISHNTVEIPVVYGGEGGPDLKSSAEHLGISEKELVERHSGSSYRVYMIGFTPGFPYLGGIDESIALPRLPQPRAKVSAGSVGIGGRQTGVYPWETPGGWRILGHTSKELFSPNRDDPSLLHAGDTVRFVPVNSDNAQCDANSGLPEQENDKVTISGTLELHAHTSSTGCFGVRSLMVEHPGFFSILVDGGRTGYRKLGVPVSGAADQRSYTLANIFAGNAGGEAALEMTLLGAKVRALVDCVVAYTGAPAELLLDGAPVPMDSAVPMRAGSLLEIGPFMAGCRGYLAVSGGFDVPKVMGSRSTYTRGHFGGYLGRPVHAQDALPVGPAPDPAHVLESVHKTKVAGVAPLSISDSLSAEVIALRVDDGPEAESSLLEALLSGEFTVNVESDRMGLRLSGPKVPVEKGDILSSAVLPGVIEVPADGKPLLLLCDCQTTGGYKRVATVVGDDLHLAGQLRPGSKVRFIRK